MNVLLFVALAFPLGCLALVCHRADKRRPKFNARNQRGSSEPLACLKERKLKINCPWTKLFCINVASRSE
jgi:hypothetical protein